MVKEMLEYHTDPERKMELEAFKKRSYRWKEIKGGLRFFEIKYGIKGFYGSGVMYASMCSNVCSKKCIERRIKL